MKRLFLLFFFLSFFLNAEISVKQIEQMVSKIHQKREGIKLETLQKTKEPFVRLEEVEDKVKTFVVPQTLEAQDLVLNAVVNESAYINGGWVKTGDMIAGFEVKFVGKKDVVLQRDNEIKRLFLSKQREKLPFIIMERSQNDKK